MLFIELTNKDAQAVHVNMALIVEVGPHNAKREGVSTNLANISFTPVRNEADCPTHQQSQDFLYLCGE